MKLNKKVLGQAQNFFTSIKPEDRIALIHDADPDGVCSGVLVSHLLKRLHNKRFHTILAGKEDWRKNITRLRKSKINKIIFTDLSGDQFPVLVKQMAQFADVLIIDHHKLYPIIQSPRVITYKPQLVCPAFEEPSQYSTTKMVYDLAGTLVDMSDLDWLAAIGVISDATARSWKPFLQKVFKKHHITAKKDYFKTLPGNVSGTIHAAITHDPDNVRTCFTTVHNAKKYADITKKLKKYKKAIDTEITHWLRLEKTKAHHYADLQLTFYMIQPRYPVQSPISTILGFEHPHQTVVIANVTDGMVKISARRQDGAVRLNDLLQDIAGALGGNGGGHIPAAGASFPKNKLSHFKLALMKALRSQKYKKRR